MNILQKVSKQNRLSLKKSFENEKIIWQFWGQGWDLEKLPDVVKISYKSVQKYKKGLHSNTLGYE